MLVFETVARAIAGLNVQVAFGVAGSGNLRLINALRGAGVDYRATCHEAGAVAMADGYARVCGCLGVATVHQGPGLTNTLTPLTEAVKSRTPLVILAAESRSTDGAGNQDLEQTEVVRSVGARATRLEDAERVVETIEEAVRCAESQRRPVVVMLPVDTLMESVSGGAAEPDDVAPTVPSAPSEEALGDLAGSIAAAQRPLIIAGRGAVTAGAGPALRRLAPRAGALLSTTIVAKGLFAGDDYDIGFLGGLASPLATELAQRADLLLAFGTSLDRWTTCDGRLFAADVEVALIEDDPEALARNDGASFPIAADATLTAEGLSDRLDDARPGSSWRGVEMAARIANYRRSDEVPPAAGALLDPRRLAIELDRLLPPNRIVAVDSGHFLAFPSMYVGSPDGRSFLFAQAFQSVGLGLGVGIGAAVARPARPTAAFIGDGGAKMSLLELDTAVRYAAPLAVIIFDDGGYGAEIHDFAPLGVSVDVARFPSRDYAAIARALGAEGKTVRSLEDLAALSAWLERLPGPIVLDCKVDPEVDAVSVMTELGAAEWSVHVPASAAAVG